MALRRATVSSQAGGLSGMPCAGQVRTASTQGVLDGLVSEVEVTELAREDGEHSPASSRASRVSDVRRPLRGGPEHDRAHLDAASGNGILRGERQGLVEVGWR